MQARKTTKHLAAGAVALALLLGTVPPILWAQQEKPIRAVTPQQKEHSKLYRNLGTHRKLTESDNPGVHVGKGLLVLSPTPTYIHPTEFLTRIACESDAVIIGTLMTETPLLTESETFIFTEYAVQVEEVLKNNSAAPLAFNNQVTVTRPGGTLELDGRTVRATLAEFKAFHLGGRYLLYLRFTSSTGAYQTFGDRSFELRGNRYIKHTPWQLWSEEFYRIEDAGSFLDKVRSSVTGPCIGKRK